MKSYLNRKNDPIIRKCGNCKHFDPVKNSENLQIGYCKAKSLLFAFTLSETVYTIVREFYVCPKDHAFINEDELKKETFEVGEIEYKKHLEERAKKK